MHANRPEADDAVAELLGIARRVERTVRDDDLRPHVAGNWCGGRADLEASSGEDHQRHDREPRVGIRPKAECAFDVEAGDRAVAHGIVGHVRAGRDQHRVARGGHTSAGPGRGIDQPPSRADVVDGASHRRGIPWGTPLTGERW